MMSAFQLQHLTNLDKKIQEEHITWLKKKWNFCLDDVFTDDKIKKFGLLNFPELWSGNRISETPIAKEDLELEAYYEYIKRKIKEQKIIHQNNQQILENIEKNEQDYTAFFECLIERFLDQAIEVTLTQIKTNCEEDTNATEQLKPLITFYRSPERSPVNFQTQDQCVAEHKKITDIINQHSSNPVLKKEQHNLKQLEILSKRKLDLHYEKVTKKTDTEIALSTVSTVTSTIGLLTGVGAIACWIGGFFFPPLWGAAAILSTISFISYASTGIEIYRILKNAANGRPPSTSDVKDLLIEAAIFPLNFIGGIFKPIQHAFRATKAALDVKVIKNIISNLSNGTDVIWAEDTAEELTELVPLLQANKLKNSTSATTVEKVTSELLRHHEVASAKVAEEHLENEVKQHGFIFTKAQPRRQGENESSEIVVSAKSLHLDIAGWEVGFFNSIKYRTELQFIQKALKDYKNLPVNATYKDRYLALMEIQGECLNFLGNGKKAMAIDNKVDSLLLAVKEEAKGLAVFIEGETFMEDNLKDDDKYEEVTTLRPLMVGV